MPIVDGPAVVARIGNHFLSLLGNGREHAVLFIALSLLPDQAGSRILAAAMDEVEQAATRLGNLTIFRLPNNDLFVFANTLTADVRRQVIHLMTAHAETQISRAQVSDVCQIYQLPGDAMAFRQVVKSYLEPAGSQRRSELIAAAAARIGVGPGGPLTVHTLAEVEAMLRTIDLRPYIVRQQIWSVLPAWQLLYSESYVNLRRLRRELFPALDLDSDEALLLQLLRTLDEVMLCHLLESPSTDARIGINLSLATVGSKVFRQFVDALDPGRRRHVVIEVNWIDALQDQAAGAPALSRLTEAGFPLVIDRLTLPLIPCINLGAAPFKHVKVRFDRAAAHAIGPAVVRAFRRCPPGRVIFTACDDERAFEIGRALSVRNFQGDLIDATARQMSAA